MRVCLAVFAFLFVSGCTTRDYSSPYDNLEELDKRIYDVTQELLSQLDTQQFETLLELKQNVTLEKIPCQEQYARMYSEGYATGHAYFTLTENLLTYWGRGTVEAGTQRNAYLAGWYDGQLRARQGDNWKPPVYPSVETTLEMLRGLRNE